MLGCRGFLLPLFAQHNRHGHRSVATDAAAVVGACNCSTIPAAVVAPDTRAATISLGGSLHTLNPASLTDAAYSGPTIAGRASSHAIACRVVAAVSPATGAPVTATPPRTRAAVPHKHRRLHASDDENLKRPEQEHNALCSSSLHAAPDGQQERKQRRRWTMYHSKLLRILRQHEDLLPRGSHVMVAVSGGQDSMALLCLLSDLDTLGHWLLKLSVVHCDHGMRPDSAANAAFVRDQAAQLQLPYYEVIADQQLRGEEAARKWRMQQLHEIAGQAGCSHYVLGHTATDRAETLLLNLIRGAGSAGLSSMGWQREVQPGLQQVRPLLWMDRTDTAAFCQATATQFWVDATNLDETYAARNRVRLSVFPHLIGINAKAVQHIAIASELLEAEDELLRSLAKQQLQLAEVKCVLHDTKDIDRVVDDRLQWREAVLRADIDIALAYAEQSREQLSLKHRLSAYMPRQATTATSNVPQQAPAAADNVQHQASTVPAAVGGQKQAAAATLPHQAPEAAAAAAAQQQASSAVVAVSSAQQQMAAASSAWQPASPVVVAASSVQQQALDAAKAACLPGMFNVTKWYSKVPAVSQTVVQPLQSTAAAAGGQAATQQMHSAEHTTASQAVASQLHSTVHTALDVQALHKMPPALRSRVIRMWLQQQLREVPSYFMIQEVLGLLLPRKGNGHQTGSLSDDRCVIRHRPKHSNKHLLVLLPVSLASLLHAGDLVLRRGQVESMLHSRRRSWSLQQRALRQLLYSLETQPRERDWL